MIFSNCDHLSLYIGDRIIEADPDRTTIPGLAHPPFQVELRRLPGTGLRIEGYVNGNKVIEKQYSSKGVDQEFVLLPDDTTLEWSFVLLMNTARCILHCCYCFRFQGPADIIGDNPSSLMGGCGAIWLRAKNEAGTVRLKAIHPTLGTTEIEIRVKPVEAEAV